jgi:DNA-binding IclR family transcriptional regulator
MSSERIAKLLSENSLIAFTENTITDTEQLEMHLAQIRADGYAFDNQEHERGVACVAAPIFDHRGVEAAISVAGPAGRIDEPDVRARLAELVLNTAREISAHMGAGLIG